MRKCVRVHAHACACASVCAREREVFAYLSTRQVFHCHLRSRLRCTCSCLAAAICGWTESVCCPISRSRQNLYTFTAEPLPLAHTACQTPFSRSTPPEHLLSRHTQATGTHNFLKKSSRPRMECTLIGHEQLVCSKMCFSKKK